MTNSSKPVPDIPDKPYQALDRLNEGCGSRISRSLIQGSSMGLFIGAAFLSWYPDPYQIDPKTSRVLPRNLGLKYMLKNLRGPVGFTALACATFTGVECVMEGIRSNPEKTWPNATVAGAVSGVVIGSLSRRFDVMAATALGTGLLMGVAEFNGQKVQQFPDPIMPNLMDPDPVEELKKRYPEFEQL